MIFNNQDRECFVTLPRSEGSLSMGTEMLRCAQDDSTDCMDDPHHSLVDARTSYPPLVAMPTPVVSIRFSIGGTML